MKRDRVRTICPYCAVGCGLDLLVAGGRAVGLDYAADAPVNGGSLCAKGNAALALIEHPERLRHPQVKTGRGWERIGWDQALDLAAERLLEIRERHGPGALGFLASAKCTNEENYLVQKLARLLGTHNVDHCARLCHASTLTGLGATLGAGAATNPFADLENSRCLLIIGANPAENHPVLCRHLRRARDRGAVLIVVDPRFTPTAWSADLYLEIRPGTDVALLNAMIQVIFREQLADLEFIARRTSGAAELQAETAHWTPERAAAVTGIGAELIRQVARRYASSPAASILYCMGVTQHSSGTQGVIACADLALCCGQLGRSGAGIVPIRGQDNVQGACDMGALSGFFPGYAKVSDPAARERFADHWRMDVDRFAAGAGLTVTEMEEAAADGRIQAMLAMGENPIITSPDSAKTRRGLAALDFFLVQDIFRTETGDLADLLLPAALWAEKAGSKTAGDRRVQWSPRALEPPGEARPDWWIICELAGRLGFRGQFDYQGPDQVLAEISRVVPGYAGLSAERLRARAGGLYWPCPHAGHPGTPLLHADQFATGDGRARLPAAVFSPPAETPDADYPLLLTTGRGALHYNSGAMSRRTAGLRDRQPELTLEIHPEDAAALGIRDGARVTVASRRGEVAARATVTETISPGVVFLPFHFEGTNRLTQAVLDPEARIPEYKVSACRVSAGA